MNTTAVIFILVILLIVACVAAVIMCKKVCELESDNAYTQEKYNRLASENTYLANEVTYYKRELKSRPNKPYKGPIIVPKDYAE